MKLKYIAFAALALIGGAAAGAAAGIGMRRLEEWLDDVAMQEDHLRTAYQPSERPADKEF